MKFPTPLRSMLLAALGLVVAATAGSALAAPSITQISLRGLQIGARTTVVLTGNDLLPEPRILLAAPVAGQSVRPGATANRVEFDIEIDPQATPGIYLLRVASQGGVSNALAVGLDRMPQQPLSQSIQKLPVALTGNLAGSTVVSVAFQGKKGDALVIDVECRRLGSSLNPVVHVYNARRTQLGWSQGIAAIARDPRLEVVLPEDGTYTAELHDILYRGAEPGFFRMKIGPLKYADMAFPLGVERGQETTLALLSTNFPPGTTARVNPPRSVGPQLSYQPVPWPAGFEWVSGSRPRILVSDYPEVVETDAAGAQPQTVASPPVAINGRLKTKAETDRYLVPVKPGQRLRIDVLAERAGSPVDGVLDILAPQGTTLATSDDRRGTRDPGLEFTVPAGQTAIQLALRDLRGDGGEMFVYRIDVTPLDRPDFTLSLFSDRYLVPKDGVTYLRIRANRLGYDGPIGLTIHGLPENMTVTGADIPAGAAQTLMTLSAAGLGLSQRMMTIVGETTEGDLHLARTAMVVENPISKNQPWMRGEVAVAVAPRSPLEVLWEPYSADTQLVAGMTLPGKVKIKRAPNLKGSVHLALASSQAPGRKSVNVRGRVEQVDDMSRMLRLQANPVIGPDAEEAEVKIFVPGDLPWLPYDLAITAEIRGADAQTMVASSVTAARRLIARSPVKLELAGTPHVEVRSGLGPTGTVTGKVARDDGFKAPVVVTLAGLPAGVSAPAVVVPEDKNDFAFEIALPYGTPEGKLEGVKLVATSQPDPNNHRSLVRSNEVPLEMSVVAGTKPPAEQPMRIFEDEPEFLANLTQGAGDAMLVQDEHFSGTSSVKIQMDQRFNPMLPGLAVKIRQKPGPGEYRYLQFAWRKQSGTACLQLAHDGKFGPTPGNLASFRYHAGGGPECFGASVLVSRTAPNVFTLVTRDLFADFGEFTLTGIALTAQGELSFFDHIYLGKTVSDFDLAKQP